MGSLSFSSCPWTTLWCETKWEDFFLVNGEHKVFDVCFDEIGIEYSNEIRKQRMTRTRQIWFRLQGLG